MPQPVSFLCFEADGVRIEIKKAVTFQKEVKAVGGVEAKIIMPSGREEATTLTFDAESGKFLNPCLRDFDYSGKWEKEYWPLINGTYNNFYI